MTFEIIKRNFELGLWNDKQVKVALDKGVINQQQYNEIIASKKQ